MSASAPLITGKCCNGKAEANVYSGCFTSATGASNAGSSIVNSNGRVFTFVASRSSSIYGASNTIRPISKEVVFMIRY